MKIGNLTISWLKHTMGDPRAKGFGVFRYDQAAIYDLSYRRYLTFYFWKWSFGFEFKRTVNLKEQK